MNKEEVNRRGDKGNFTFLYGTKATTRRTLHHCKMMLKKKNEETQT